MTHSEEDVIRLGAEIERLRQYACQCEASVHATQERYAELQLLLARAADALEEAESALSSLTFSFQSSDLLIAELRKAAQ